MKKQIAAAGLIMSTLISSCGGYDGHMMNGQGHMNGYGNMWNFSNGGIFMWISFLLLAVLIVVGVYFFYKKGNLSTGETALDILKKRFAKGEITKEEFEEMKKNL